MTYEFEYLMHFVGVNTQTEKEFSQIGRIEMFKNFGIMK